MQCPYCSAVLPDDDLFCEECGQRLEKPAGPLCLCGAPDGDLDEDGYCLQCGRRCRPAPGEIVEAEFSQDFAAVSNRGLRHRRNEDRALVADLGKRKILVVCDGVSSANDAQAASDTASRCLLEELTNGTELAHAFRKTAEAVSELGEGDSAPSTTVVAAVVEHGRVVHIGWLGDSRAYWIAPGDSKQLTSDHSWLNEVVTAGEMSYADAMASPRAHGITRWIGADADGETSPSLTDFEIPGPGWLLLCTDGLWNYTPDIDDLERLVSSAEPDASALEIARYLVTFANEQGGHDNITVALLRLND